MAMNSLTLIHRNIGDKEAQDLSLNPHLTSLELSYNNITDEGVKTLVLNPHLTSLNLMNNHITDEGAKILALNTSLTSLDIRANPIGDEGVKVLNEMNDNRTAYNTQMKQLLMSFEPITKDVSEHILFPYLHLKPIKIMANNRCID